MALLLSRDLFICAKDLLIAGKEETPATRGYVAGRGPLALRCGNKPHRRAERPLGRFDPVVGFVRLRQRSWPLEAQFHSVLSFIASRSSFLIGELLLGKLSETVVV
jgi:hypothetical protein